MATLKDHQQAMVDLLASGSGIPASASRLAHAMHDVLAYLNLEEVIHHAPLYGADATTPGLNDKALAADVEACRALRPEDDMYYRAKVAERRVKELENTCKQLRASNAAMRLELAKLRVYAAHDAPPEQAGCRKQDTQVCEHSWNRTDLVGVKECLRCGVKEIRE